MSIARVSLRLWPFVAVLVVTVGLKIAAVGQVVAADQASIAVERQHIANWLRHQHFSVGIPPLNGLATVEARRAGCKMIVAAVDGRGIHRELVNAMRPASGDMFFVHHGLIYPEQPVGETMLAHHLWARSRDLGLRLPRHLVLGVVGPGCARRAAPWSELTAIP